jgi:hypothetical protein
MLFSSPVQAQPSVQPARWSVCVMEDQNAVWMRTAIADWESVRRQDLRVEEAPQPWIIFFDASCAWHMNPQAPTMYGVPHGGHITLPDGSVIDVKVTSFAGTYGADDRPYMVMALLDIWRADPRQAAEPQLDRLLRIVFVHEMTHTLQAHSTGVWFGNLQTRFKLPDDLTDDIIQDRFAEVPGFREAYEAERDLLYRAAGESDPVRRRSLAAEALDAMKTRRAKYFGGANAVYADLEDLFLNMEGVANWAAYRLARRESAGFPDAIAFMRRGGKRWSQDEGLALFLVIDAAVPEWQSEVFGSTPVSVIDLLSKAVR